MSVPKSERGESVVEFIAVARQLHIHTLRKCAGFPKRYTFYLGQPIALMAGRIYEYVVCANSIYPTRRCDAELRRNYLTLANSELRALVAQIEVACELFGLSRVPNGVMGESEGRKADAWMELVWKEINLVKGVLKSDARRYGNLPE